jgi:uncharacterized protein (TIGR03083 family)
MRPKPPVIVTDLFVSERRELLELLRSLPIEGWSAPTVCDGWSVKDLAAHILRDDFGNLSGGRDGYSAGHFDAPSWEALVAFINRANESWVTAARPLSPGLLTELLEWSGHAVATYFANVDLLEMGGNVAWAGAGPMPRWLDVAREYTEKWAHQQQIRDTVAGPSLRDPHLFHPVLDTYVHALPHSYRTVSADDGAHVLVVVTGDAGGRWSLVRHEGTWGLYEDVALPPSAVVTLDDERAWRLFTKAPGASTLDSGITCEGDQRLGGHVLSTVAVIA